MIETPCASVVHMGVSRTPLPAPRLDCGMSIKTRNNVHVHGEGPTTLVLSHGFGSNQNMWHHMLPLFASRYRVVTFDLVGSGGSDSSAYSRARYGNLHGYADDLLEVVEAFCDGPCVHIGHSVSSMVGLLAAIAEPGRFAAQVMVGPSPCYLNDEAYEGGFTRDDIDELLDAMAGNYLGWSSNMAPTLMGVVNGAELGGELTHAFSSSDPAIARHFAEVTFLSDHRADLSRSTTPTLIVQSTQDPVVPVSVGHYLHAHLPHSALSIIDNVGHYPHMSTPGACAAAISTFLQRQSL
jgi:sigma-B regulation protein RsbQ